MKKIKLSEYCRLNGITYRTGWGHFKNGDFGENGVTNDKGGMFILVEEITNESLAKELKLAIAELKEITNTLKYAK